MYLNILYFISAFCVQIPPFQTPCVVSPAQFPRDPGSRKNSCEARPGDLREISGRSLGDLWPLGNLWGGDISMIEISIKIEENHQ